MYWAVIGWVNKLETLSFGVVLPVNSYTFATLGTGTFVTLEVKFLSVEYWTLYFVTIWSE